MVKKTKITTEIRKQDLEYIKRYAKRKEIEVEEAYAKLLYLGLQVAGEQE